MKMTNINKTNLMLNCKTNAAEIESLGMSCATSQSVGLKETSREE